MFTVEDAVEINPPRVERFATDNVSERVAAPATASVFDADTAPVMFKVSTNVDDADATNHPVPSM